METGIIRERLQEYIRIADDRKVQAIYTIVEEEIQNDLDLWKDEKFLNEMKSREDDYATNPLSAISLEELKAEIRSK